MELDAGFFAVAIPAILFSGIDKAGFGSSASVAAAALLALVLEPGEAVAIMLPLLVVMDFVALRPNWRRWDPGATRVLLPGAAAGALAGAGVIFLVSDDAFRLLIGIVALAFVALRAGRRAGRARPARPLPDALGLLLSAGAGLASFVAHSGGPLAAVYLLSRNMAKPAYQATTIVSFWAVNLLKLALYLWLGLLTWQTSLAALYLLPAAVAGTLVGVRLNRVVPERRYFAVIHLFLALAGAKLVLDALA